MNPPANEPYKTLTNALVNRLRTEDEETSRERRNGGFQALTIPPATESVNWCSGVGRSSADAVVVTPTSERTGEYRLPEELQARRRGGARRRREDVDSTEGSVFETSRSAYEDRYARLEAQISALTAEMSKMRSSFDRKVRARPRFRPQPRSRSRNEKDDDRCWYHRKYAEKAHRCHGPCSYSAEGSGNETGSR
ncbi:hypothetical protein NQ318_022799 [Aromia moschata]|uniref:Uncharacterized protein n=1 Tax=Aromia moschata TaxID=1265417 RepID=A0AAV8YFS3_9CUCU|nr:hypothetical protein NQ318_022799 [Aromia moschata]